MMPCFPPHLSSAHALPTYCITYLNLLTKQEIQKTAQWCIVRAT